MCGLQDINPVTNMFNSRSMLTNLWQFDLERSARFRKKCQKFIAIDLKYKV